MPGKIWIRSGTKHGAKHIRLNYNNQDAMLCEQFGVPAFNKTFQIGLVSDGVSGNTVFSHTEVGSNLLVVYCYRRIQEMICSGMTLREVVKSLYPSVTEFSLDLLNKVMPKSVHWPYPVKLKGRDNWNAQTRFQADYLAATLLGFLSDNEETVVFTAGDGITLVGDDLEIIDQDNEPAYPASTINQAHPGFTTKIFKTKEIFRVAVMTDGPKHLVKDPAFRAAIFENEPNDLLGLQYLLNTSFINSPGKMQDDCTIVAWEYRVAK